MCIHRSKDTALKWNDALSHLIVFHIYFMQCKNMLVSATPLLLYDDFLNTLEIGLLAFLYLRLVLRWRFLQHMDGNAAFVVIVIFTFWCVSYLLDSKLFTVKNTEHSFVLRNVRLFIAYCLPLFVAVSSLDNTDKLLYCLYRFAPLTFWIGCLAFVIRTIFPNQDKYLDYSMSFGNQMLLTYTVLVFRYVQYNQKKDLLYCLLTTSFILIAGSRGPIVSILACILYFILRHKKSTNFIIFTLIALLLLCIVSYFSTSIVNVVAVSLNKFGITSRNLVLIQAGQAVDGSGRSKIFAKVFHYLNNSPLLGYGAFGGEKLVGLTHSLYLDIFMNFGYIFGFLFMFVIGIKIFLRVKNSPYDSGAIIIQMMGLITFPRGPFNGAFWTEWQLWVIMGLLLGHVKEQFYDFRDKKVICKRL